MRCFIFGLFFGKALPSHFVKMDQARETQPKGASKSIDGLLDEMEDDDGGFGEPVGKSSEDQEKCGFGNRDTMYPQVQSILIISCPGTDTPRVWTTRLWSLTK